MMTLDLCTVILVASVAFLYSTTAKQTGKIPVICMKIHNS